MDLKIPRLFCVVLTGKFLSIAVSHAWSGERKLHVVSVRVVRELTMSCNHGDFAVQVGICCPMVGIHTGGIFAIAVCLLVATWGVSASQSMAARTPPVSSC
jgi:hypothetical protein